MAANVVYVRISPEEMQERQKRQTDYLRGLATSPRGLKCAEHFDVPEVDAAEAAFQEALQEIRDPEIRNRVDTAAGKIAYAYQILGFCAGHFSQDSRSYDLV